MDLRAHRPGVLGGLAVGLGVAAGALILAAVLFTIRAGWSWADALGAFVVSNAILGLSFASCGSILARHRPGNPIGWLFLAGGLAQTVSAVAAPLGHVLLVGGAPVPAVRLAATLFVWSWPWAIGLCIPLGLMIFPDGRPPSPRWRPVIIAVIVTAPLFNLEMGAGPGELEPGAPSAYLILPFYDRLQPLWTATEIRGLLVMVLALVALAVRYRRGTELARRQLLWLLLAVLIMVTALLVWGLVRNAPIIVLFSIALIPVAITVAIVRNQLLDIRLVLSRALAWALLSLAVLLAYTGLLALFDRFVAAQLGRSALVTVILVLVAAPVLPRLQRLVDRAMYGERANPVNAATAVGSQLATADADLGQVLGSVRGALRLPYAALVRDGEVLATDGERPEPVDHWPLTYRGQPAGTLELGLRPGERSLSAPDRKALGALAAPMAAALEARAMSTALQQSREHLITATAEERRRLRRELHDGLGPTLTGIAFTADAATNLLGTDLVQAEELLTALRRDSRVALADVRRIVEDLRPPALDELGLVGALQQRADQLVWRADGSAVSVHVDVPQPIPALPAAVEVATYRIATEALTNIARHSRATTALIRLEFDNRLEVSITDDGVDDAAVDAAWTPGVGLIAMRERAAELGGALVAGPSATGGRVSAWFPLQVGG